MVFRDDTLPVSPSPALARPRLLELLSAVEPTGLALVVAPVGYGKTTVLGQWSAARGGVVRWYEPDRLPSKGAVRRDLDGTAKVRGIVIDDVHRVESVAGAAQLERLVADVAQEVPVVLASRRLPAFNLARCELPRAIVITARDMSFRPWEVAELFSDVYADPLRGEEPLVLADRTEGWAAALHLWHLARRMDQDNPGGKPPDCVRGYLTRQVLNRLDPELLRVLRTSSVFEVVTADRVDRLMGTSNGHRLLTDLASRVDLVLARPDGQSWRFHRTLRDHLRADLVAELGPAATLALFDEAAVVAEQLGDLPEALAARGRAHNARDAARLLGAHGLQITDAPGGWLGLLSAPMTEAEPLLRLARARLLLADGRAHEAETEAMTAAAHLTDPKDLARCDVVTGQARRRRRGLASNDRAGPASPADEVIGLLVRGRPRCAQLALARAEAALLVEPASLLAAQLALVAAEALLNPRSPAPELDRLHDVARRRGLVWLSRLAYAVALCRTAEPRCCAEARALAVDRRRAGDELGAALVESAVAFALLRRGRPDIDLLDELSGRFRLLGSPQLEAWARSAHALAEAEADLPDAEPPESAQAFARAAAAPGALALAYAALAASRPDQAAELLRLAESTARESGLACRPWTWKRDAVSQSSPPTALRVSPAPSASPTSHTSQAFPTSPAVGASTSHPGAAATSSALARHTPLVCSELSLTCFGEFSATAHGHPLDLAGIRPVALTVLRILAAQAGTPVHREVILDALWGGLRETAALHNLHVAVSSLRQGLECVVPGRSRQLLARQGQAYVLAPGTEHVTDLQRFDAHLAAATRCRHAGDPTGQTLALREAVEGYAGDVLPGDGAAEWVVTIRDRYRQKAAGAAARLAELELSRHCAEAAVAAAQRSVQIDPWRDASWRTLILAHDRAGELAGAERARQEYAAVLDSLGVHPIPRPASPRDATPTAVASAPGRARPAPVRTA